VLKSWQSNELCIGRERIEGPRHSARWSQCFRPRPAVHLLIEVIMWFAGPGLGSQSCLAVNTHQGTVPRGGSQCFQPPLSTFPVYGGEEIVEIM
jgi:hypothetical protein